MDPVTVSSFIGSYPSTKNLMKLSYFLSLLHVSSHCTHFSQWPQILGLYFQSMSNFLIFVIKHFKDIIHSVNAVPTISEVTIYDKHKALKDHKNFTDSYKLDCRVCSHNFKKQ